jgi:hypothetical protein
VEVLILLGSVGLSLVCGALVLFARSMAARDYQHADRLALLALEDDTADGATPRTLAGRTEAR